VLYIQERVGKDGKEFNMLKFRTMIENAEQGPPVWADEDDPRCTKIGKKLRKYRLDELPQLWNIFVGHMSVVGPRPERRYFYNKFEEYIPGFSKRLKVKPGLTGLAQVNGGYYLLPEEKIKYDLEYIKTRSIWCDLKIILHTVRVVFKKEGAK
jgi:lipopolysaccharide/colanic/teichoic acid biosynthesis glycosyltransferase